MAGAPLAGDSAPEEYLQVFTTTEKRTDAENLARVLVEKRLAGCVQIVGPIASTYRWQGKIEAAQEWLCLIKTSRSLYEDLEAAIKEAHRYETPEIVAVPIVAASEDYLEWLAAELGGR